MSKNYKPVNWREPSTWGMVAIALLVAIGIPLMVISSKRGEQSITTGTPTEKKCDLLLGNIGAIADGEVIYTDSQCTNRIGLFMGTSKDGSQVGVRRDSDGQIEMVDRDTITHSGYIKH